MFLKLQNSEYVRSLLVLTSGTFIAQLIPILFYPVISRLFLPEQFGSLSVFTQIANILSIIAPGGYLYAIFICQKKKTAINVLVFTILLSLCILCISTIVLYISRYSLSKALSETSLVDQFYIPVIMAFSIIIFQCYNEWCVRNKQFKQLSVNKSVNSGAISISEFSIGFTAPNLIGNGLLAGDVIGRIISACSCLISIFRKEFYLLRFCSWESFVQIASRFSKFPKFIMPAKLLNTVARSIPVFFISAVFTKEQLGFFSMANMVLVIPVSVISIAVSDGFRQKANTAYTTQGTCRDILIKTIKPLIVISILGFSLLFALAPMLFEIVLGSSWVEAGVYSRYLVPIVAIEFISEVVKPIFIITGNQHFDLIWQILFLISMILLTCINFANIYGFLIVFTAIKSMLFLFQFFLCYKLSIGKS